MIVSPFGILFALYCLANFISVIFGVFDGGMSLEGSFFELSEEVLIWSFLLQLAFLFCLWAVYKTFFVSGLPAVFLLNAPSGIFLLFMQLAFIAYNYFFGVNIAGVDSKGGGGLDYIFMLLPPDLLFLLIGVGLKSKKLFWINCIVFFVSMFLRGWMGGVFVVLVLVLCRSYPTRVSLRSLFFLGGALVLLIALLPFVIEAKWAMRSGMSVKDFYTGVSSLGLEQYGIALRYVLNRFQHVGHVALMMENAGFLYDAYLSGSFIPYWADGLPQMAVYKFLGLEYVRLNSYMVYALFGYPDAYWNTNPGLAGWVVTLRLYSILFFVYVFSMLFFTYWFLRKYAGAQYVLLISCFSLVYLFHGWIGAFFNLSIYAIVLIFVVRAKFTPTSIKSENLGTVS